MKELELQDCLSVVSLLAGETNEAQVGISSYNRIMVEKGYTRDAAVRIVQGSIEAGHLVLTSRFSLELPEQTL